MRGSFLQLFLAGFFLLSLPLAASAVTISTNLPNAPTNTASPGDFINYLYKFALYLSGILAFGAIVYGGIKYTLAAGNPGGQNEGKEWIKGALTGLLLLVGTYAILNVINPNIVSLSVPLLDKENVQITPEGYGSVNACSPTNPTGYCAQSGYTCSGGVCVISTYACNATGATLSWKNSANQPITQWKSGDTVYMTAVANGDCSKNPTAGIVFYWGPDTKDILGDGSGGIYGSTATLNQENNIAIYSAQRTIDSGMAGALCKNGGVLYYGFEASSDVIIISPPLPPASPC